MDGWRRSTTVVHVDDFILLPRHVPDQAINLYSSRCQLAVPFMSKIREQGGQSRAGCYFRQAAQDSTAKYECGATCVGGEGGGGHVRSGLAAS